jgi:hypothetical protein
MELARRDDHALDQVKITEAHEHIERTEPCRISEDEGQSYQTKCPFGCPLPNEPRIPELMYVRVKYSPHSPLLCSISSFSDERLIYLMNINMTYRRFEDVLFKETKGYEHIMVDDLLVDVNDHDDEKSNADLDDNYHSRSGRVVDISSLV